MIWKKFTIIGIKEISDDLKLEVSTPSDNSDFAEISIRPEDPAAFEEAISVAIKKSELIELLTELTK